MTLNYLPDIEQRQKANIISDRKNALHEMYEIKKRGYRHDLKLHR
jgi:hypothetical protein